MWDIDKKRSLYAVAAMLVVAIVVWTVFRESAIGVETGVATRGRMTVTIDAEGKTRVRDRFTVTAPIAGVMARIKLSEGDNIPSEYPIAEIDPNPPIPRTPSSPRSGPNPYAARVFAPAAGQVLRGVDKSERFVTAGTPILELGDPENLEIVVDILSSDAVFVRPGAAMLIESDRTGESIRARVTFVETQAITKTSALGVEEQRVNVVGEFLSRNIRFGDKFRVDVKIITWEGEQVLMVPSAALFRRGEDWSVFVVEGGRARQRMVTAGHRNAEFAEIVDGLHEGDVIVLHPPRQLIDGARVSPMQLGFGWNIMTLENGPCS